MDKTDEYRKLAKSFALEKICPLLGKDKNYFIAVSGSTGYGFADELSDLEIEVYVKDNSKHGIIERMLEDVINYKGVEISASINTYWGIEDLLNNTFQISINENPIKYYEIRNSYKILDPSDIFQQVQKNLHFYNDNDKLAIIRGLYLQCCELGSHVAVKMASRNKFIEANIGLYTSLEALLRLTFILNNEFFPHTKWLTSHYYKLPQKYGLDNLISEISLNDDIKFNTLELKKFADDFGKKVLEGTYLTKKEVSNPWSIIDKPESYIFYPTIYKY
jgi:hypothetical protein